MKNFNKILLTGAILLAPTAVNAASANVAITGENSAMVNDTITLNIKVNNVLDADVVAVGGDILYNPEYLTLIDTKSVSNNYSFDGNLITDGDYRIAGVDFTMENGIKTDSIVYSLVFRTKKSGNTEITFNNAELVNTNASVINATTTSKVLNINEKQVAKEIVESSVVTNAEQKNNSVKEVKVNNNLIINTNNNVINNINTANNSEKELLTIIDRLNPVMFDDEAKGLTIDTVKTYSIYNYKKEN